MPTYVYRCEDCNTKYEIFHKTQEHSEDVICPSCNSKSSKKLMAAASIAFASSTHHSDYCVPSSGGGCASGNCPYN